MTAMKAKQKWIHVPQSFCGRLTADFELKGIAGICTTGFTSCHIAVLMYKSLEGINVSLIHLDICNHGDVLSDELEKYQKISENGSYKIFIFKHNNIPEALTNHFLRGIKTKYKYKIVEIPENSNIDCIAIPLNNKNLERFDVSSIQQITVHTINQWISDSAIIRHTDEWKLVAERKVITRIKNAELPHIPIPYLIFNGVHWCNAVANCSNFEIYKSVNKFVESIAMDTTIFDIAKRLLGLLNEQEKKCQFEAIGTDNAVEFVLKSAVYAKLLKHMTAFGDKFDAAFTLKSIINENCLYLLNLFNGKISRDSLVSLQFKNIPNDEKKSVIECCKSIIKIEKMDDLNENEIKKICRNYCFVLRLNMLFLYKRIEADYIQQRKFMQSCATEFGTVAMEYYKCNDFIKAKYYFWQVVNYYRYLYYSPSNELSKVYYNYGAAAQNANDKYNAEIYLQMAYYANEQLLKLETKTIYIERKKKTETRLKQLGIDIDK